MPEYTRPKIVCFPSNHGVGAKVMKNCMHRTRPQLKSIAHSVDYIKRRWLRVIFRCSCIQIDSDWVVAAHTWLPFVSLPLFAIDRIPAPVCFSSVDISSSNCKFCVVVKTSWILIFECAILRGTCCCKLAWPRRGGEREVGHLATINGFAATASACWVTSLNHEIFNDSMHLHQNNYIKLSCCYKGTK